MPKYLLSIEQPDGPAPEPEILEPIMREVGAIRDAMREAGIWVFGGGLTAPESATVVRDTMITDGPYVEGKEHLGGITVIDVPDLDTALHWTKRLASVMGLPIEVRAFHWS
ncbi:MULTISPECIES: YciI family protein [Catenuloplanes]|uniref:YCII-related domain-containing protein n=1 Tax=Catenuloplanes niger TaxID=587534 RepID=A0AAE3ZWJ2_9ACTN|nr:YciI family protein [Catenuloplanes niger]MDR7326181.1 hypothetical protein [Catenuloplanes niger]